MFKIKDGYFDQIKCPEIINNRNCTILNCIFKHSANNQEEQSKKRSNDNDTSLPPRKKIDISPEESRHEESKETAKTGDEKDSKFLLPKAISHLQIPRSERTINTRKIAKYYKDHNQSDSNKLSIDKEHELAIASKSVDAYKAKIDNFLNGESNHVESDPKYILPKEVIPIPPATLQVRKKFIQMIVETFKKVSPGLKNPILRAIDEEFKIASSTTTNTYAQTIKKKLYEFNNPEKFQVKTKTLTESDYLEKLDELVIPRESLTQFGYVMDVPTAEVPNNTRTCKRCNIEFKMEDQLNPTQCHFHSGKTIKTDKNNRIYQCCGGIVGGETDTCSSADYHVFSWNSPQEMQWALPFKRTNELFGINKQSFKAIGIDCEMGFTTKGFELLRITAIDFFSGEEVLDILVKPMGEVVDLNTKWSGISEIKSEALTFEDSINLLGEIMDSSTILIGHGLENDLNSMRLIHERIIDTAILYPKHKTSPTYRYPLKYLAFKYLGRTIQTGQHDSCEDSLAAIDVVKYFINLDLNS